MNLKIRQHTAQPANGGAQNGSSVGIRMYIAYKSLHVLRRFACSVGDYYQKILHRSSVRSLLRVRCWLGNCTNVCFNHHFLLSPDQHHLWGPYCTAPQCMPCQRAFLCLPCSRIRVARPERTLKIAFFGYKYEARANFAHLMTHFVYNFFFVWLQILFVS